jgi:hypothetical protein
MREARDKLKILHSASSGSRKLVSAMPRRCGGRGDGLRDEAEAASTLAELQAIQWED